MDLLRAFNGDDGTKSAVLEYINNFIAEEGLRRMFAKEDVSHIADAKLLIDKAFDQLSVDYGLTIKPTKPINEAR